MKKHITLLAAAPLLIALASCGKGDESWTRITTYPDFELVGDSYATADVGVPYVDPGFTCTLFGKDIADQVKVSTNLDLQDPQPGYYSIYYTVKNEDNLDSTLVRHVLVADANDPASGYYYTSPASYRDYNGQTYYGAPYFIVIYGYGDGTYSVSDLLGGWYAQRAGYGSNYAMTGDIAIAPDGTVTLVDSFLAGWGDSLTDITGGTFDAATGTLEYTAEYTDTPMYFHVIMNKQ